MKIAVGLSGGVDSSVTAHLLQKEGHEVIGLTMKIWDDSYDVNVKRSACFGPDEAEDIEDARALSKELGIPYHVVDLSKEYSSQVLDYFRDEYKQGRTPNPCVRCNHQMKFHLMLEKARESGVQFDLFATGHYARVEQDTASGRYLLKRGLDDKKDQSYFLALLTQDQLSGVRFPLGAFRKEEIKAMARELGLKAVEKKESQDFYAGDYEDLLDIDVGTGQIINSRGEVMGEHEGYFHYTIGQRRGLGVAYSEPLYVVDILPKTNQVVVGTDAELLKGGLKVVSLNMIGMASFSEPFRAQAKIRYRHNPAPCMVIPQDERSCILRFDKEQRAITPGQYAVVYQDDLVLAGGVIDAVVED
ncbi:MAG: tRNA 2-thiouridine(34) synthase MnmA [Spirochaetales bacterium]|nr:tRNA 2-thiouridine(34) synthase MnmA [Spirochaetales bacterium]